MSSFLYVITMAVAFTNMFNGELTPFYVKYAIAIGWIIYWIIDFGIVRKKISIMYKYAFEKLCLPYILIAVWSCLIWIVDKPLIFDNSYVSRMIANVAYIIISYTVAIVAIYFFGKKAIKLSVIAMFLSVAVNLIYVVSEYGVGMFFSYLPHIFSTTDYEWGTKLFNFSLALEVQDITMASGFYLIYYLFFDMDENRKDKVLYIVLLTICAVIGFKRTTAVGLILAGIITFLIRKKRIAFTSVIYIVSAIFIIISFGYVLVIKNGLFATITTLLDVDANGRTYIYNILSNYYDISLLYLGKGFGYVDKIMYESTNFAAHSVIVRMFAEIGFIPFFIWLIHYLISMPKKISKKFGAKYGSIAYIEIIYMFTIFFMENTLTLFCIQFSFALLITLPMWQSRYSNYVG